MASMVRPLPVAETLERSLNKALGRKVESPWELLATQRVQGEDRDGYCGVRFVCYRVYYHEGDKRKNALVWLDMDGADYPAVQMVIDPETTPKVFRVYWPGQGQNRRMPKVRIKVQQMPEFADYLPSPDCRVGCY